MTNYYRSLIELVKMIEEPNCYKCLQLWSDNAERFAVAQGSSYNHQAWPGGYLDHLTEIMNIAVVIYEGLSRIRPLPFSLSDALFILFIHDLEKPWRYDPSNGKENLELRFKNAKETFRLSKLDEYGFILTPAQNNALKYIEGEKDDYSNSHRAMNELAAFCHCCDTISARTWHDKPERIY